MKRVLFVVLFGLLAVPVAGVERMSPKCAEWTGSWPVACWQELADQPGCHVHREHYYPNETVRMAGPPGPAVRYRTATGRRAVQARPTCRSGSFDRGTLSIEGNEYVWPYDNGGYVWGGSYVDGRKHGPWVEGYGGYVWEEGHYVDGKKVGRWVERYGRAVEGRAVEEGPYVDGKRNGRWVERSRSGDVWEGPYVDGRKNGYWVQRFRNGEVWKGSYVDGLRNGRWDLSRAGVSAWEGFLVDGRQTARVGVQWGAGCLIVEWSRGMFVYDRPCDSPAPDRIP